MRKKAQKKTSCSHSQGESRGWFVYFYLRTKDLTPYYVGIASDAKRPRGKHTCVVPKDRERIQIVHTSLTERQAKEWEVYYISFYGRKDLGTGILRNLTDGGEGNKGGPKMVFAAKKHGFSVSDWRSLPSKDREVIAARYRAGYRGDDLRVENGRFLSARIAKRLGIPASIWDAMPQVNRERALKRHKCGKSGQSLFAPPSDHVQRGQESGKVRQNEAAAKYEVTVEEYTSWDQRKKSLIAMRYSLGHRGSALLIEENGNERRLIESALKVGIEPDTWRTLSRKERLRIKERFRAGTRGDSLLEPKAPLSSPVHRAALYGMSLAKWQSLTPQEKKRLWERRATAEKKSAQFGISVTEYESLSHAQRTCFMVKKRTAKRLGVDFALWSRLSAKERAKLSARHRRGVRGTSLLD